MIRANKDKKAAIIIYKAPSPKQNGFYLGAMGFFFRGLWVVQCFGVQAQYGCHDQGSILAPKSDSIQGRTQS